MKNKALRPVILSVAVLAVLAGVYVWLSGDEPASPSPSPSSTSGGEDKSVILTQIPQADIDHVTFTPKEGSAYTIALSPGTEEGLFSYRLTPAQAGFSYQESRLSLATSRFDGLSVTPLVLAQGQRTADFGLDEPRMTVTIVSKTGGTVVFRIGANNATQSGAFVQKEGDDGLYLLGITDANNLTRDEIYFRDLAYLPAYPITEEEQLPSFLASIRLEGGKQDAFAVRQRTSDDGTDSVMPSQFVMMEPVFYETSDYYVLDMLIEPISAIDPSQVVEDHPDDLTPYGLANPYTLTIQDTQGRTLILRIGDAAPEGGRYVMLDGRDAVLLDTAGSYDFLNLKYTDVMSKLLWLYNIETVDMVTMSLPDALRVLRYMHTTDEDGNDVRDVTLDETGISSTNGSRLYTAVLSFTITGAYADTPSAPPEATLAIRLLDGVEHTMHLYYVNERMYAAGLDGQTPAYTVSADDLKALRDKLQIVDEGGELKN